MISLLTVTVMASAGGADGPTTRAVVSSEGNDSAGFCADSSMVEYDRVGGRNFVGPYIHTHGYIYGQDERRPPRQVKVFS